MADEALPINLVVITELFDDDRNLKSTVESEELDCRVTFHSPVLGKHERAYREIVNATDEKGNPRGSDLERHYAAAWVLVARIEFGEGAGDYAVNIQEDFADAPRRFIEWLAHMARGYLEADTVVPFRSTLARLARLKAFLE
jgi:hypothetical protein